MTNKLENVQIDESDALRTFDSLVYCCKRNELKLMVLIDEYDRFANKLMFENPEKYMLIVEGKRGDATSSPIRSFFERLKQASNSGLIDFRSLIVGITPIALADASGYNVAENISQLEIFGDSVGFTEHDLRIALNNIGICNADQNNVISIMKKYYNGYHFPGSTQSLFNPTLSMYFLDKLASNAKFKRDVISGKDIPIIIMTDSNTKISENVFSTLATADVSAPIVQQLTSTNNVEINTSIVGSFKLREIIDPPTSEENERQLWDNTLSFMYYHGMVTFTKEASKEMKPKNLIIPNEIARIQYLEQLQKIIKLNQNDVTGFISEPTEKNLKLLLDNILSKQETIYDNSMSEGGLQTSIESALRAFCLFRPNIFESITAEKIYHTEGGTLRADLVLTTSDEVFVIELKRIRPNALTKHTRQILGS